jgi:hypothetical protein
LGLAHLAHQVVPALAGALAVEVDVAIAGAGEALQADDALGEGTDADPIGEHKAIGAALVLYALVLGAIVAEPRNAPASSVHYHCVGTADLVAGSADVQVPAYAHA